MRDFSRSERVNDLIRNELATALIREARDPRLATVSINAVKSSDCLSFARVYWVPLSAEKPSERELKRLQRALENAAPFLRGHLSKTLTIRHIPELRFVYDESIERGRDMENLLHDLKERGEFIIGEEAEEEAGDEATPPGDEER